jgi:RNA polymerase sigma-70 factor (ECF subfamily)
VTTALSHLRRERRRRARILTILDDEEGTHAADRVQGLAQGEGMPTPEAQVADAEAAELVCRHLDDMGDKYRRVFLMRFRDGYSEAEIAHALGLSVPTVKIRAHRARVYLRQQMAGELRAG